MDSSFRAGILSIFSSEYESWASRRERGEAEVRLSFGIFGLNDTSPERFSLAPTHSPADGVRDYAAIALKLHFPFWADLLFVALPAGCVARR